MTPEQISARMRLIRGKDTTPEMKVRRLSHRLGFRHRLHARGLPGRPDLIYPSRKCAILVHGCFWHQHEGCRLARIPKARPDYWIPKLARNKARDRENVEDLHRGGWRTMVIWECETKDETRLAERLFAFLSPPGPQADAPPGGLAPRPDVGHDHRSGRGTCAGPR